MRRYGKQLITEHSCGLSLMMIMRKLEKKIPNLDLRAEKRFPSCKLRDVDLEFLGRQ